MAIETDRGIRPKGKLSTLEVTQKLLSPRFNNEQGPTIDLFVTVLRRGAGGGFRIQHHLTPQDTHEESMIVGLKGGTVAELKSTDDKEALQLELKVRKIGSKSDALYATIHARKDDMKTQTTVEAENEQIINDLNNSVVDPELTLKLYRREQIRQKRGQGIMYSRRNMQWRELAPGKSHQNWMQKDRVVKL
ncbi:MAG TPA: hypothetical protein VHE53_04780 [Patescibacteria group bacterium]|nr:hypothetical protein [Patescibacteria group bacterium]